MQWFWEVIDEMTPSQQRNFLKFMTSCSRQPLLGFRALSPLPCITKMRSEHDDPFSDDQSGKEWKLPISSTCMNLLKLPDYTSKEMLKKKLLYAVESGSGFELS